MKFALIESGLVVNLIEAEDSYTTENGVAVPAQNAQIGWRFDGTAFLQPEQEPSP